MPKLPTITQTTPVAQSRLFEIESVDLTFSNGERRQYERVCSRNPGAVMVVPMRDPETLLLIQEYGVGVEQYTLGFPKGAIDPGESPIEAAQRELQEEIGYGAHRLEYVKEMALSPGYFTARMHLLFAFDLFEAEQTGDEPEPLTVVPWSIKAIDTLLDDPACMESRTIAALLWIARRAG